MIIGSHVSYGKEGLLTSVKEAISYGANTFMFYTGAPTNTIRKDIDSQNTKLAWELMKENNIDINNVICHAPYIINPATPDLEKRNFAINFLIQELQRCQQLGIKYIVLHPGSSVDISIDEGLANIVTVLKEVLRKNIPVTILIETMAGKGSERGINIAELAYIIKEIDSPYLGVCLDTCHLHDSGVDLTNFSSYLEEFAREIGLEKIKCLHLNDSKNILGAHKDRHANIGFGQIGFQTLLNVINNEVINKLPIILETPYIGDYDDDKNRLYPPYKYEIKMLREKKFNPDLLNLIRLEYKK